VGGSLGPCDTRFWELVTQEGLTHVYFDAHRAGLRPRSSDDCPSVKRVYAQDGIYVYQLLWPGQDWGRLPSDGQDLTTVPSASRHHKAQETLARSRDSV